MFLADLYNNKRLFENISPIDLAEMLFNGLMQKYPEAVKQYGHEVVGDAVMNYAEDAEDIHSMSDVDIAIQEIMDDLANYRGDRTNDLESDSEAPLQEDLSKWFKEKWVRFGPDGKIRGACARGDDSEGKPKCLPQAKAHALGKKGRKYAAAKKRREDPNPERRGPAKNVATKKKTNEGVAEGRFDEPLTGWHIVYRKSGNPVHATPSFETKDQAQKYLMTRMFANHQDYKVVHTAGVGVAEATEMPVSDHNTKPAQDYDIDLFQQLVQNYKPKSRAGELVKHYLLGPLQYPKSDDTIGLIDEIYYEEIANGWEGPSLPEEVSDLRFYRRAMKKSLYQGVAEGSTSHAELAKMAHDAYVAASRKGNGPMAAYYLKQYLKHKADAAKDKKGVAEAQQLCPECGGPAFSDLILAEKQDACYHKVKSRYKVWPSAYASGALVQCRKKGAANWGKKKTNEAKESPTQDYQKMMNFVQAQRLSGVPPEQQVAVALFKELEKTKAFNKQLDAELKAAGERADIGAEQGELATKELGKHRGELEKEKQKQQASRQQLQALSQQLEQLKTAPNVDAEASQAIEQQIAELEQKMQDRQGTGVSADKIAELEQAIAKVQQGETVDADAIKKLEQQFAAAETAAKTAKEKVGQVKDYESAIAKLNAEIDALTAEVNKDEKQIADIQGALANTVEPTVQKVAELEPKVLSLVKHRQATDRIDAPTIAAKFVKKGGTSLIQPNNQQPVQTQQPPVTETRFYFTAKATLAETLRSDFAMTQDSKGWYLTAAQGPAKLLEAQRAFGIPKVKQVKLKEVRISDYTGRAGTIGDENATSPIGSLPRQGRRHA